MALLNGILVNVQCRTLIIWLVLFIFGQILFFTLMFSEMDSVPRQDLLNKFRIVKLLSNPVDKEEIARTTFDETIQKKFETKSSIAIETSDDRVLSRNKVFISRRLEKLKNAREMQQKSSTTSRMPVETQQKKSTEKNLFHTSSKYDNFEQETGPDDIFISVKTTKHYHSTRLEEIRNTWYSIAKKATFFFTDTADTALVKLFNGHLVNTNCSSNHQRRSLCCKMGFEFNFFWENHQKRWFCHFDDDSYVIFPSLIKLLRQYNHSEPVYLGKPSLLRKMQTWDKHNGNKEVQFWFGTGGAGFCLSQKLMSMMKPHFSGQAFIENCERIGLPDDCTVGFIIEYLLGVKMIKVNSFHSHLESLEGIPEHELRDQVSLSHGYLGRQYNRIKINETWFSLQQDPSRFKSLHCHLYPQTPWCKTNKKFQDKL